MAKSVHFDWLVVGAGLTGATFAERIATELGGSVVVIDRRSHVAGNAYDHYSDQGVLVHRYGAHIFHTVSERVWRYLSRFTEWRSYEHRVLGSVDGLLVPIPFNLTTLHALMPGPDGDELERRLIDSIGFGGSIPVLKLLTQEDPRMQALASLVYEKIFRGYSAKQWGMRPEELDRSVTGRVPVVISYDDRYFQDPFQGIPTDGYTAMVDRMLDHPSITVELNTSFTDFAERVEFDRLVYTGPLDELLGSSFGSLPYRSLRFQTKHYGQEMVQPVGVINYPTSESYTRTLEHKHLTGQRHEQTAITTEWSEQYVPGENEPYYPILAPQNREMYEAYRNLANETYGKKITIAGRLADYRYYNMDQAVNRALVLFRQHLANEPDASGL